MQAADEITKEHRELDFKVLITEGTDTVDVVHQIFGQEIPKWLELVKQSNNINEILERADCFVSSSVHETFSYAIAEATLANLPVIQSDIEGTSWNLDNPSTWRFKSGDVQSLKKAMIDVMNHSDESLVEKCEQTRRHNIERYSLESWSRKVIDYFRSI